MSSKKTLNVGSCYEMREIWGFCPNPDCTKRAEPAAPIFCLHQEAGVYSRAKIGYSETDALDDFDDEDFDREPDELDLAILPDPKSKVLKFPSKANRPDVEDNGPQIFLNGKPVDNRPNPKKSGPKKKGIHFYPNGRPPQK